MIVRTLTGCALVLAGAFASGCGNNADDTASGPGAATVPTASTAPTSGAGGARTSGSAARTSSGTSGTIRGSAAATDAPGEPPSVLTFGTSATPAGHPSTRTSDPREPATQGPSPATSSASRSVVPPEAVQAVNDFAAALGKGDADAAKRFFISQEEFGQLFRTDAQSSYYTSLKQEFDAAVDKAKAGFTGAELDGLKLKMEQAPAPYPAGASIDQAVLTRQTYAMEDIVIDVRVGNATKSIYFDYLVKTDAGWRAFSAPDFEGNTRRREDRRSK